MKASEVKRKTMISLTYGPCPITSLIPWKKPRGSVLGRQSRKRRRKKKWCKMTSTYLLFFTGLLPLFILHEELPFMLSPQTRLPVSIARSRGFWFNPKPRCVLSTHCQPTLTPWHATITVRLVKPMTARPHERCVYFNHNRNWNFFGRGGSLLTVTKIRILWSWFNILPCHNAN